MTSLFADSFYYLALLNPDDFAHRSALELAHQVMGPKVTTEWVMTEVGDALAAPGQRELFLALLAELRSDVSVTIVPASHGLFERGIDLYARRPDKEWSLTDCLSFVVMQEYDIREALTGDHHFEQAGFKALLA